MKLVTANVGPFRSINEPQEVPIDPEVTVIVGMNEAGKTVFLKALHKSNDALGKEKFSVTDDYPRKDLTAYKRRHEDNPDNVVKLTYAPTDAQINKVNTILGTEIQKGFTFSTISDYKNSIAISISVEDDPALKKMATNSNLSDEAKEELKTATGIRNALTKLLAISTDNETDKILIESLTKRVAAADKSSGWDQICAYEAYLHFNVLIPKFLYFSDYDLLPGKLNLADLKQRVSDLPPGLDTTIS